MQQHESWWGNLTAGGMIVTMWHSVSDISIQAILTAIGTVTYIGWTVEKWRVERVRRRGYEMSIDGSKRSHLGSLWARMRSSPGVLDSKPHVHSYDTEGDPLYRDTGTETQAETHRGKP